MRVLTLFTLAIFASTLFSCNSNTQTNEANTQKADLTSIPSDTLTAHLKPFNKNLPTIGLLIYPGVLTTEVTATADVFSKPDRPEGKQLFNVITIAETDKPVTTEEGLNIVPDYTFETCPKLTVLFVPSAYDMYSQVRNAKLVDFIKTKNEETTYTVSNCAGAQLIGASHIADGHKIVTYIGGGVQLQKDYPNLKVQNDSLVRYVEDGKYFSSNGNLISYVSALNVLEKLSSPEQVKFVESYLYLNELQDWKH